MSSITLPLQSFRSAQPLAAGASARGLAVAMTQFAAPLRSAFGAAARRMHALSQAADASALRERALSHLASNPSFAADLMAAANHHESIVERA